MVKETRKVAIMFVNPTDFASLFKTGAKWRANIEVMNGLPKDAEVQYIFADPARNGVGILVKSESFEPVEQGAMPPFIQVDIKVGK